MNNRCRWIWTAGLLLAFALLAQALSRLEISHDQIFSLSFLQYIMLPAVLLIAARAMRFARLANPTVIIAAASAACIAATYNFSPLWISRSGLFIATSPGDLFEISTRLTRERIEKFAPAGLKISRLGGVIENLELFTDGYKDLLVLWNTNRWINIHIPSRLSGELSVEAAARIKKYFGVSPQIMIPYTGLSKEPLDPTAHYIAALTYGLQREGAERELYLLEAASIVAPWTSSAHRAFAFWLLGNQSLALATESPRIELPTINCAIRRYGQALKLLVRSSERELAAAVRMNLTIARIVRSSAIGKPMPKKKKLDLFLRANGYLVGKNHGVSSEIGEVLKANISAVEHEKRARRKQHRPRKVH